MPPGCKHCDGVGLMPAQQSFQHIVTGSENIAHIVKDGEAETFSEIGQADWGKRSSSLFTNRAVPPTGKPESGSRGPA